jgi:hypothetical protein
MEAKKAQWRQVNSDNDSYGIMSINQNHILCYLLPICKMSNKGEELVKYLIKYCPTAPYT